MNKRFLALFAALFLLLSLAACGRDSAPSDFVLADSLPAGCYAEAQTNAELICSAALDRLRGIVDAYLERMEAENSDYFKSDSYFLPMYLNFLSDVRPLMASIRPDSEESGVYRLFAEAGYGLTAYRHGAEDTYAIDFKTSGGDGATHSRHIDAEFNAASCSLSFRLYDTDAQGGEGELLEFFEFSPQGGGAYAIQDMYSRMYVTYVDGEVTDFVISEMKASTDYSGKIGSDIRAYDPEADSIYQVAGLTEEWATEKRGDLANIYALRGGALTVERCVAEITTDPDANPLKREWVWKEPLAVDPNAE